MALSPSERLALFRDNLALQIVGVLSSRSGTFTAVKLAEILGTGREHVSAAIQRIRGTSLSGRLIETERATMSKGRRVKHYSWRNNDIKLGAGGAPDGAGQSGGADSTESTV